MDTTTPEPDVFLDDQDPDDLGEVDDVENADDASTEGLPEGPAPEDDDWSDIGDTHDLGTAQPDDTHPTAD